MLPGVLPCFSEPMPQPELQCNLNLAGLPIELVCVVGMVASVSWKKDGCLLPPEKHFLLSGNLTELQIRNGEKLDCGSYSCSLSKPIMWKEAALNLVVIG